MLDADRVDETDRYSTLAGYILRRLGHLPGVGEEVIAGDLVFEVVLMDHPISVRCGSSEERAQSWICHQAAAASDCGAAA
ncbi:transporter associated domain-containing protein [Sinorhizobium medicae]|uniref:transporter associated domain-containing protein n=1 Tax=Sinorhizobium medicae TaxID=110321 RepID=UPI0027DDA5F8|nr:transporter associated domain-containing protein [Sinorhizobium medicae]